MKQEPLAARQGISPIHGGEEVNHGIRRGNWPTGSGSSSNPDLI